MGQYYVASNVDRKEFICPRSFGSGSKLTETCYVGNGYVDALTHLIAKEWHGDTVVVCGDYAWGGGGSASARLHEVSSIDPWQRPGEERGGYVSVAIRSATSKEDVSSEGFQAVNPRHFRYVVNETKGVYYDRTLCPVDSACVFEGKGAWIIRVDPLTIFLACGNGLDGGDYRWCCRKDNPVRAKSLWRDCLAPNEDMVGSWVGDVLSATDERPVAFSEIPSPFDPSGLFVCEKDDVLLPFVKSAFAGKRLVTVEEISGLVEKDPS